jgi:hypothetical protein
MSNNIYLTDSTPIIWASGFGNYQLSLQMCGTGLNVGPCRVGAKGDLGASRPEQYCGFLSVQFNYAPTAGNSIQVYWAPSPSSTAGAWNPANLAGVDGTWNGYTTDASQAVRQLQMIGAMSVSATTTTQVCDLGPFTPYYRYGFPVIYMNDCTQPLASSNAPHFLALYPAIDQVQ